MEALIQVIINAILLGGLYAVIGVGMSMIFGIVKLTNLAHGDFLILASYLSFFFYSTFKMNPLLTLILVVPIMFFFGMFIQNTMLNRVLNKGAEPPLLITFGMSIIVQNALLLIFTPDNRNLSISFAQSSIAVTDGINISWLMVLNFVIGLVMILLLSLYLKKTYQGRAIRAASDDGEVSQLMGVNIKSIYGIAMGIAMITAALAGVLIGMTYNFFPSSGTAYLIIAFGVVVIGGMGSIQGTFVAGLIFALAQLVGAHYLGTSFQLLSGYAILLIMLIFRPQGLFAKV